MLLLRVIAALEEFGVRYAIAGGHAVALHGAPRGTLDIDLVIRETASAYIGAEKALVSIGFQSRLPVKASEVFYFRKEYRKNRNLVAWNFLNPERPSEIVDILLTANLDSLGTEIRKYGRQSIRIVGLRDLIQMKQRAARPQDLADVEALREIRKLRERKR